MLLVIIRLLLPRVLLCLLLTVTEVALVDLRQLVMPMEPQLNEVLNGQSPHSFLVSQLALLYFLGNLPQTLDLPRQSLAPLQLHRINGHLAPRKGYALLSLFE